MAHEGALRKELALERNAVDGLEGQVGLSEHRVRSLRKELVSVESAGDRVRELTSEILVEAAHDSVQRLRSTSAHALMQVAAGTRK